MTIPIFITARLGSTRLPRKHFLKLGSISVIEHIVRRCEHFGFKPIVCVPKGEEAAFREHTSGEIFGGDAENVEARLFSCARNKKEQSFHHLDGDDPFFDNREVWFSWNKNTYTSLTRKTNPTPECQAGQAFCGSTYADFEYLTAEKTLFESYEIHPWPQRLTLDYEEDYHLLCAVNRMVGGYMAPRWAVDKLFLNNPDLYKVNWFRNDEWKERQLAERSGR